MRQYRHNVNIDLEIGDIMNSELKARHGILLSLISPAPNDLLEAVTVWTDALLDMGDDRGHRLSEVLSRPDPTVEMVCTLDHDVRITEVRITASWPADRNWGVSRGQGWFARLEGGMIKLKVMVSDHRPNPTTRAFGTQRLDWIRGRIQDNPNLSMADLAREMGLSVSRVRTLVKQALND